MALGKGTCIQEKKINQVIGFKGGKDWIIYSIICGKFNNEKTEIKGKWDLIKQLVSEISIR